MWISREKVKKRDREREKDIMKEKIYNSFKKKIN